MAVYGLTRVSTHSQIEGTSLEEQRRKIAAVAELAGFEVAEIFEDAGVSGSVPLAERPEGGRMAAILQTGDVVICTKIDRLFRSAADALATVEAWRKAGIDLIVADFGSDHVTESGTSMLLVGILAMVGDFERGLINERMAEGKAAKRAKGGHIGGAAPFGYRKEGEGKAAQLVPIPAEQLAIDTMQARRAAGDSLRKIAAHIEDRHGFRVSWKAVRNALERRDSLNAA
jgi:DNA invertase Pin-like site-specific DNA recombinase